MVSVDIPAGNELEYGPRSTLMAQVWLVQVAWMAMLLLLSGSLSGSKSM